MELVSAIVIMSHGKRSEGATDLDRLFATMKKDIEADKAKMKRLLESDLSPKQTFKPKFIQKKPTESKRTVSPEESAVYRESQRD